MIPEHHVLIEDLREGQQFSFSRSVTKADMEATMRLTGDFGGYHTDERFAQAAGFQTLIVPGMFQGAMMTHIGGSVNLLAREITVGFSAPVYVGDTLTCTATLTEVDPAKRRLVMQGEVRNQDGIVVVTFRGHGYLPKAEWGVPDKSEWQ